MCGAVQCHPLSGGDGGGDGRHPPNDPLLDQVYRLALFVVAAASRTSGRDPLNGSSIASLVSYCEGTPGGSITIRGSRLTKILCARYPMVVIRSHWGRPVNRPTGCRLVMPIINRFPGALTVSVGARNSHLIWNRETTAHFRVSERLEFRTSLSKGPDRRRPMAP